MATRFSGNEYVLYRRNSKGGITDVQLQDEPPAGNQRNHKFTADLDPLGADPICTLLRAAKLNLKQPAVTTARDLMTMNVVTIRPEDSIKQVARMLGQSDLGALPVVDGSGRLLGTITERDIAVRVIARGESIRKARVSDHMSSETFACSAGTSIEDCMRAMSWHQVRRIPIVDDDHKLIGILSQVDIARYICEQPEHVKRQMMAGVLLALAS